MNIIETYKSSTSKLEVIEKIKRETGKEIPEIFVELIEAKVIDGRLYRQGRYSKEWAEAKKMIKNENIKKAESATTSMNDLKKENEKLNAEKLIRNAIYYIIYIEKKKKRNTFCGA